MIRGSLPAIHVSRSGKDPGLEKPFHGILGRLDVDAAPLKPCIVEMGAAVALAGIAEKRHDGARLAEGVFDIEDVKRRAQELADFVGAAAAHYGFDRSRVFALGFSNGANIAAAMLMLRPDILTGAALLRAMVPLSQAPAVDLAGKRVLMISGAMDPIIPADNSKRLAASLSASGAEVQHEILPAGHNLSQTDLQLLVRWFAE